ncbi:MAG: helix-turn-helix transcriptional regulator [Aliidongia sp.]
MVSTNEIAEFASVIGEPARTAMLIALMDGRALTATELASVAGITPQTASTHLARLSAAGLLKVERQGRHRYHRLAGADVARMLEGIMQFVSGDEVGRTAPRTGPRDEALRRARTCYDHLAGRLGVGIADALIAKRYVEMDGEAGIVTQSGVAFFSQVGMVLPGGAPGRHVSRPICRPCLDWSERRPHLAGRLGAAICTHGFEAGWLRRIEGDRAVDITPTGRAAFGNMFGIVRP